MVPTQAINDILALYRQVISTLDEQVAAFQQSFAAHMHCRKGCSQCCRNIHFKISTIEAYQLKTGYAALPASIQTQIRQNIDDQADHHDCPLLIDNACSLYEHRPALCRAYGIILALHEQVSTCPLNFNDLSPRTPLQTLSLAPYYDVLSDLSNRLATCIGTDQTPQTIREGLKGLPVNK